MTKAIKARLDALRANAGSDEGFTLIELMVAVGILATALILMAYTSIAALSYTALSRQRQGADGLAGQTMEQIRALPFSTLQAGLGNADLANSVTIGNASYDPNITLNTCGVAIVYCYQGEQIPRGNNVNALPLVPHQQTVTSGPTTYIIDVYITFYQNVTTSNTFRVTVQVKWTTVQVRGVANKITTQSIFYSPSGGCVSANTHPFAAPCQPFFYGTADTQPGSVQLGGTVQGLNFDPNNPPQLATNVFSSDVQVEQISAVQGIAQTSGAELTLSGQSTQTVGEAKDTSAADNDPAHPGGDFQASVPYPRIGPGAGTLSATGSQNTITLTSSASDVYATTSTTSSSIVPVHPCGDPSGVQQTDSLPCGNSNTFQKGTMSMVLNLTSGGTSLGDALLAQILAPPTAGIAYTDRDVVPQAGSCLFTNGDGCMHAAAQQTLGTVSLAGLPGALPGGPPAGWAGYLVRISNYSSAVSAEAGVGTSAPTVSASGTISYWNGAGYSTLAIAPGASVAIPVAPVTVIAIVGGATVTVSVSATLSTGGTASSSTVMTCAPVPCPNNRSAASATAASPVVGTISYSVTRNLVSLANASIIVNLGQLEANTTYKPTTAS